MVKNIKDSEIIIFSSHMKNMYVLFWKVGNNLFLICFFICWHIKELGKLLMKDC